MVPIFLFNFNFLIKVLVSILRCRAVQLNNHAAEILKTWICLTNFCRLVELNYLSLSSVHIFGSPFEKKKCNLLENLKMISIRYPLVVYSTYYIHWI